MNGKAENEVQKNNSPNPEMEPSTAEKHGTDEIFEDPDVGLSKEERLELVRVSPLD
jgi:hypothetical protein